MSIFARRGGGGGVYEDRVDERVAEWIADEWGCGGTAGWNAEHSETFTVGGSAELGGEAGAEAGASPSSAPISQRSGAVDYASAAKAGVATAVEGSFAAALVGKGAQVEPVLTAPLPPTPIPPAAEKLPALTAAGVGACAEVRDEDGDDERGGAPAAVAAGR